MPIEYISNGLWIAKEHIGWDRFYSSFCLFGCGCELVTITKPHLQPKTNNPTAHPQLVIDNYIYRITKEQIVNQSSLVY